MSSTGRLVDHRRHDSRGEQQNFSMPLQKQSRHRHQGEPSSASQLHSAHHNTGHRSIRKASSSISHSRSSTQSHRPAFFDSLSIRSDSTFTKAKYKLQSLFRRESIQAEAGPQIDPENYYMPAQYEPPPTAQAPDNAAQSRSFLRRATTFRLTPRKRNLSTSRSAHFEHPSAPVPLNYPSVLPIPGNGLEPPFLPDANFGGAAARAAAAAAQSGRNAGKVIVMGDLPPQRDNESGIGFNPRESCAESTTDESICSETCIVKMDFVAVLPAELTSHIFSFIDHKTLLQCELVSRSWKMAASSHHVWREAFLTENRSSLMRTSISTHDWPSGKGLGKKQPNQDWKRIFKVRNKLRSRWTRGDVRARYLSDHGDSVYCVQFDEHKIITGSRDQTIRIWDIKTGECIRVIGSPRDGQLKGDDPSSSAVVVHPINYVPPPQTASSVRASFDIAARRTSSLKHHQASVLCLQFDATILVSGSSDSTCIMWSITDGYRPIRRLRHHTGAVLDLCLDSKYIVSCSKDASLCVWDRETGDLLKQLFGHRGPVNAVQMRGNLIVSASGDSLVKMWNLDTGKCIREFTGHSRGLACVQFSEDARLIVSGGNDQTIRVWDANTGVCLKKIEGHRNLVRTLYLDSDNDRIISGSYDVSIKVFSVSTGKMLLDFPMWHSSWILSVKADYRRIISTSQDSRVLILDFGGEQDGIELLESS